MYILNFQRKWWEVEGEMKDGTSNGTRKTSEKEIDGSLISGSGNNMNGKEAGRALSQHAGLTHPLDLL